MEKEGVNGHRGPSRLSISALSLLGVRTERRRTMPVFYGRILVVHDLYQKWHEPPALAWQTSPQPMGYSKMPPSSDRTMSLVSADHVT